jgi:hypothetical protein
VAFLKNFVAGLLQELSGIFYPAQKNKDGREQCLRIENIEQYALGDVMAGLKLNVLL